MNKRPIQKMDLVPEWIREAVLEAPEAEKAMPAQPPTSHEFRVPNLGAAEPAERKISAELYKDPSGQAVVQLVWKGATSPVFEFSKKYATWKDAEMVFSSLLKELRQVESYVDVDPARAKENVKKLLDEYKGKSDTPHAGGDVGSRTLSVLEIADGWNIVSSDDRLSVSFSDTFLKKALAKFKVVEGVPAGSPEQVYSTASRQHCGTDNFVISFWKKVNTADGNIIRNAALVSRIGGSSQFVSGVTIDEYNTLCTALTPNPPHYGIAYDSVTSSWYRTSVDIKSNLRELVAMVVERISGTPEEIAAYDANKKGKAKEEPLSEEKPEKKKKDDESLPLEDEPAAPESAPLKDGELPSEDAALEDSLADMIGIQKAATGTALKECRECGEGFHGKCKANDCNCYMSTCQETKEGSNCAQCQLGGSTHCKKCSCCK